MDSLEAVRPGARCHEFASPNHLLLLIDSPDPRGHTQRGTGGPESSLQLSPRGLDQSSNIENVCIDKSLDVSTSKLNGLFRGIGRN